MSNTLDRVKAVTANLLKIPESSIKPESRFVEDLGAKSIQSVELIATLEEEFDVEIDETEAGKMKTVAAAAGYLDRLLAS